LLTTNAATGAETRSSFSSEGFCGKVANKETVMMIKDRSSFFILLD
jgi:hypothetical protein